MTTVHLRHAKALGYCARGIRGFFDRYGLDYRGFLSEGTDAEKLLNTGDWMAAEVVKIAEAEAAEARGGQ